MKARAATILITAALLMAVAQGQQPSNERRVLLHAGAPAPGYETVLVQGTIPIGGREGRHTHPGTLVGYVQSGTITLEYEGRAPVAYGPGESFEVEPGKIHEGINTGDTPVVVIATFIVEKGKPMTTQVD